MATTEFKGVTLRFPNTDRPYVARAYVAGGIDRGDGGYRSKLIGRFATADEANEECENFRRNQRRRLRPLEEIVIDSYGPTLPSQISKNTHSPALLLRAAVVEQAKKDLESNVLEYSKGARLWFMGQQDSPPTFSFKEICEMCEGSPEKAVKRITATLAGL